MSSALYNCREGVSACSTIQRAKYRHFGRTFVRSCKDFGTAKVISDFGNCNFFAVFFLLFGRVYCDFHGWGGGVGRSMFNRSGGGGRAPRLLFPLHRFHGSRFLFGRRSKQTTPKTKKIPVFVTLSVCFCCTFRV